MALVASDIDADLNMSQIDYDTSSDEDDNWCAMIHTNTILCWTVIFSFEYQKLNFDLHVFGCCLCIFQLKQAFQKACLLDSRGGLQI